MDKVFHAHFPNLGFVGADLSEEDLKPIRDEVEELRKDSSLARPLNDKLVGHIRKEFSLKKCHAHLERLALELAYNFRMAHHFADPSVNDLFMIGSWVNFQRKLEFNPLHHHDGEYVFVLWLDVPYTIEEEKKFFPEIPDKNIRAGYFAFQYIDSLGHIMPWTIPADKSYVGKMILFPASLNHEVHPFYSSDEYRISVAGNLHVRSK